MSSFASLLAAARGRRTQEAAASVARVHRNTLGRWERGVGFPSPAELGRLCDYYALSVEDRMALLAAPVGVAAPVAP
jgi:transcriptional regulator with XRE-family HTH domain